MIGNVSRYPGGEILKGAGWDCADLVDTVNISVIIPCHNLRSYIAESLNSVAAQTFPAQEIIVVDDSSTDGSIEVVKNLKIPTKIISVNYRNAAAARNAGVAVAGGEWVAFLDGDDIWLPHHLSEAKRLLEKTDDIAYMGHRLITDGSVIRSNDRPPPFNDVKSGLSGDEFLRFFELRYFNHQGVIIKTEVVRSIDGYDEGLVRCEDSDMFLRAVKGRTWTFNPDPVSIYRQARPGNLSNNRASMSYYFLKSLLNNRDLYAGSYIEKLIDHSSIVAMSETMRFGDKNDQRRAWELARKELAISKRSCYQVLMLLPKSVRSRLRKALRR